MIWKVNKFFDKSNYIDISDIFDERYSFNSNKYINNIKCNEILLKEIL
jgi:hypothetical protein